MNTLLKKKIELRQATRLVCRVVLLCMVTMCSMGCNDENEIMDDPYAGGRAPLEVKVFDEAPTPETAKAGEEVTFHVAGLAPYCHPDNRYDFEFYLSDMPCTIVSTSDSTLTIQVPEDVASGKTHLILQEQIFYGPKFNVKGNVQIDLGYTYSSKAPTNGYIYDVLSCFNNTEKSAHVYMVGDFMPWRNSNWGGVACVNNQTGSINSNSTVFKVVDGFDLTSQKQETVDGETIYLSSKVNSVTYLDNSTNPFVLFAGSFSSGYAKTRYKLQQFNNILMTNKALELECHNVYVKDSKGKTKTVSAPRFIGGAKEEVLRAWPTKKGKSLIAIGALKNYKYVDYDASTCDEKNNLIPTFKYKSVASVMRLKTTKNAQGRYGELDEGYRQGIQYTGVTGTLTDGCPLADDGMILVGNMTDFDGVSVSNIVKLDAEGNVDMQFLNNVGTGADGTVERVSYFKDEKTSEEYIALAGSFTHFNGKACWGLAVLRADGTFDSEFTIPQKPNADGSLDSGIEGGHPNFVKQLAINGKRMLVVSGRFTKYGGVARNGFLILDAKGYAPQEFNTLSGLMGDIYDAEYTLASDNMPGLLLAGSINYFGGKFVNNVVMLKLDFRDE